MGREHVGVGAQGQNQPAARTFRTPVGCFSLQPSQPNASKRLLAGVSNFPSFPGNPEFQGREDDAISFPSPALRVTCPPGAHRRLPSTAPGFTEMPAASSLPGTAAGAKSGLQGALGKAARSPDTASGRAQRPPGRGMAAARRRNSESLSRHLGHQPSSPSRHCSSEEDTSPYAPGNES